MSEVVGGEGGGVLEEYGVSDLDDLEGVLDARELDNALDRLDPGRTRRRLVLLGAGSSVEAGLPTSAQLDAELRNVDLPLYRLLSDAFGGDVERVAQLLELLADDSPLSHGMVQLGMTRGLRVGSYSAEDVPKHATAELRRLVEHLRVRFWLPATAESAARCAYLAPLVAAQRGGAVATLNYDNTLQRTDNHIDDGGGWHDTDVHVGYQHVFRTRILPVHGHLGWELRQDAGQDFFRVVNASEHQDPADLRYPYSPAIIFGASNKLRHYGPFLPLLDALRRELNAARTVITIGYSWRDPHINGLLREWADTGHEYVQKRFDHIEGPPRWRLFVGTGPTTAELPALAAAIRTHMGSSIEVRPMVGTATKVIGELHASHVFAETHIGTQRKFWCGA